MTFRVSYLSDISLDEEIWGGKAVSLLKLINAGLKVPEAIVVSTDAYNLFSKDNIDIREFDEITAGSFVDEFVEQKNNLIVRSSANIENIDTCSSSGVFESYIFNRKLTLFENIKKVWCSTQSDVVNKFCLLFGLQHETIRMAVILQVVKRGKYNAVIQSRDIINGLNRAVLEYTIGNINSIVDSEQDANIIYLDYDKDLMSYNEYQLDFSDGILERIKDDCLRIEEIFGGTVEIEAQIDGEDIYYIQARRHK